MYQLLTSGSNLAIQIVNYERVLNKQVTSLPTISNEKAGVKLIRNYELKQNEVEFKTELHTPEGKFNNSVSLYPLTAEELQQVLDKIGFTEVNFYGGFDYEEYQSEKSFPLVVKAVK
jgi:hypothetical protein